MDILPRLVLVCLREARKLNHDMVLACRLDDRFGYAKAIHTAAEDFGRLRNQPLLACANEWNPNGAVLASQPIEPQGKMGWGEAA